MRPQEGLPLALASAVVEFRRGPMLVFTIFLLALLLLGSACSRQLRKESKDSSLPFDKALDEKHVPLPPNQESSRKPELSCYYYAGFMVKEVDLGEKGAEQLSIIHMPRGRERPSCQRENVEGEVIIEDWGGYFMGVKGKYVFFDGDDGWNDNSRGFAIFEGPEDWQAGRLLFWDHAEGDPSVNLIHDGVSLRYKKVYEAPCSLRADLQGCWNTIKQATGLTAKSPPDCSASYEQEEKRMSYNPELAKEVAQDPSVVDYEVEVVLAGSQVLRITPVSEAMTCTAAE
jgi:hypothetical protein